jgi:hypothetical protein
LVDPVIRTLYGGAKTALLPAVAAAACTHSLELRLAAVRATTTLLLQLMLRPDVLACSACMLCVGWEVQEVSNSAWPQWVSVCSAVL